MDFEHKDRMLCGYPVTYHPEHFNHTLNTKAYNGYVYEHRYVVEKEIGRPLKKSEIVHHIDGNKLNNDISNLMLMTRSEHAHLHMGRQDEEKYCEWCGKKLATRTARLCRECSRINSRKIKNRPSKQALVEMKKSMSYCAIARLYGVTDNTIRKWMK